MCLNVCPPVLTSEDGANLQLTKVKVIRVLLVFHVSQYPLYVTHFLP